jgi:uncharacterized phage-associated protein
LESSNQFAVEELNKIKRKIEAATDSWSKFEEVYAAFLSGEKKPDEYTGYRAPHLNKIANMIVYFAQQMQPYKTKLNKLLFYADFLHFRNTSYSISGATYKAIQMGPVPKNFGGLFDYATEKGFVTIELEETGNYIGEKFMPVPGLAFDQKLFEPTELDALATVAARFADTTVRDIVKISHDEPGWKNNVEGFKPITYKYGFSLAGF